MYFFDPRSQTSAKQAVLEPGEQRTTVAYPGHQFYYVKASDPETRLLEFTVKDGKQLYELPDEQLSAAAVLKLADEVEDQIQGGKGARPLLSVPHLLSDEASCYYHGYVLAEMGVHQTREFVLARDGYLVDNPKVGPTLREAYWLPGNSEPFLGLVENLTGKPLTGDAWVNMLKQDVESLLAEEKVAYDAAAAAKASNGKASGDIDLDMRIKIIDGDDVIADTAVDGGFLATCAKFQAYVAQRFPRAA